MREAEVLPRRRSEDREFVALHCIAVRTQRSNYGLIVMMVVSPPSTTDGRLLDATVRSAYASIGVALATVALAIATFWLVRRQGVLNVHSAEALRLTRKQLEASLLAQLSLSAEPTVDPNDDRRVTASVFNLGVGPAIIKRFVIYLKDGTTIEQAPSVPRALAGLNTGLETRLNGGPSLAGGALLGMRVCYTDLIGERPCVLNVAMGTSTGTVSWMDDWDEATSLDAPPRA
jgi:hypothetical protein